MLYARPEPYLPVFACVCLIKGLKISGPTISQKLRWPLDAVPSLLHPLVFISPEYGTEAKQVQ